MKTEKKIHSFYSDNIWSFDHLKKYWFDSYMQVNFWLLEKQEIMIVFVCIYFCMNVKFQLVPNAISGCYNSIWSIWIYIVLKLIKLFL